MWPVALDPARERLPPARHECSHELVGERPTRGGQHALQPGQALALPDEQNPRPRPEPPLQLDSEGVVRRSERADEEHARQTGGRHQP